MPTPITIALSLATGVSISAGLTALFVALRRERPELQLTFAVMCLLIALNDMAQLLTYNTPIPDAHLALFKTQITLSIMVGIMMLWFSARYTGLGQSRFLVGWSAFGLMLIVANTALPNGVLFSEFLRVDGYALPWGEQIFLPETRAAAYGPVFALFPLGVFIYSVYGCAKQYLRGEVRHAIMLGGVSFLIGMTASHDLIVDLLSIKTLSLFEFGLFGLVVVLSVQFSDEIISAERDLRSYQDKLETLVEARTNELSEANKLLAREIGVRKHAEETLQNRVRELNTLNRISHTVTSVNDLPRALEMVAESVTALFNASGCYIFTPDPHLAQISALQDCMRRHDIRKILADDVVPLDVPAIRQTASLGEALIIDDTARDARTRNGAQELLLDTVQGVMLVPLKTRGEVIGCLGVATTRGGESRRKFTATELSLFENIAADIASAIENARLYVQAQQAAVDIERQRLARELHDSVTQSLYSLTLLANGWGTMAQHGKLSDVPGSFRQLVEVGQQALREMRLLIHQLRPPILEEAGLAGALRQRLEAVERRVDIQTKLVVDGDTDSLSMDVQEQLFQIAQEALNNSLRHAQATHVLVELSVETGLVTMSVEDDGIGYDPDTASIGMGTHTMRERARQIGGSVHVRSAIQAGTTVEVTVHLNPQPAI